MTREQLEPQLEIDEEVDQYLSQGIAAMSVDRLRSQYCRPIIMTFKQPRMEQKVTLLFLLLLPPSSTHKYHLFSLLVRQLQRPRLRLPFSLPSHRLTSLHGRTFHLPLGVSHFPIDSSQIADECLVPRR